MDIEERIAEQDFGELSITLADAARASVLPGPHQDTFDRVLIAQAQAYNLVLISNESLFDHYGIRRLW